MASDNTLVLGNETSLQNIDETLFVAGWQLSESRDAIKKSFKFGDFPSAMAFMTRVAFAAEAANHHPEWFNVYNRVDVVLTTHDASGVTSRDLALARVMEQVAGITPAT